MPVQLYPVLAAVLFASNAIIPQFGLVASVFSPLVLMLYLEHPKRNRQTDILLVLLIAGMGAMNYVLAAYFVISPLFTATFIRWCRQKKISSAWLPVAGSAALAFAVTFIIVYGVGPYRAELVQFAEKALKTFMATAKQANAPMVQSPYFAEVEQHTSKAALSIVLIFPAFNYIYSAMSAFVSSRLYNRSKKIPVENFRMPDNLVWALIASFALLFIPVLYGRFVGLNIAVVLLTLYVFQGFDILLFWMNKLRILPFLKVIFLIFIFSEPPIILIVSLIGLFSVWFNFYGKKSEEEQEKSE